MQSSVQLSIVFWLHAALQYRSSILSNSIVYHTSGGISSSPAAFFFLLFLSTKSSSSCVNCPSLMFSWLQIIFVIGSSVTFEMFPQVCSFFWTGNFQFSSSSTLPSTHFVYCLTCYPRLSIFNWVSNLIDLILDIFCLFSWYPGFRSLFSWNAFCCCF